ncbi:MAG TPA: hypothetical protein VMZ52_17325 [Bryobacteraceae bacterium]|nr:hypothetical protein [Bryobacteraceae bacterium]
MRRFNGSILTFAILASSGCTRYDSKPVSTESQRQQELETERSAARKAGKAAHEIADESRELAKKAGQKLKEAGHEVKEGWKDAKREKNGK